MITALETAPALLGRRRGDAERVIRATRDLLGAATPAARQGVALS